MTRGGQGQMLTVAAGCGCSTPLGTPLASDVTAGGDSAASLASSAAFPTGGSPFVAGNWYGAAIWAV